MYEPAYVCKGEGTGAGTLTEALPLHAHNACDNATTVHAQAQVQRQVRLRADRFQLLLQLQRDTEHCFEIRADVRARAQGHRLPRTPVCCVYVGDCTAAISARAEMSCRGQDSCDSNVCITDLCRWDKR